MSAQGCILVVDDDRLVLATVVHGLQQQGYRVIDADNGDDAILLARQHRPDLALLDIRMDGKSGFDVAAYLRDALQVPFMFLSAFSDADTLARAEALGALRYLVKPLDVAQIIPHVQAVMAELRSGSGPAAGPASTSAPTPASAPPSVARPAPSAAPPASPQDAVALAVGVLMHRHSLDRRQAWQRLQRLAADQGQAVDAQAERLLAAVEELARTGS